MKPSKFLMLASLFLTSCATSQNLKFYGDEVTVDYPKQIDHPKGQTVSLEGEYTGIMYAYDGLLVFDPIIHPDGLLLLYDLNTGKRISAICPKGQGPNEYWSLNFDGDFVKDSGETYLWINNGDKNRIERLNTQGKVMQTINTAGFRSTNYYGIGAFNLLNDSLLCVYVQAIEIFENQFSAQSHHIFNYLRGETVKKHTFYSEFSEPETAKLFPPDMGMYLSYVGGRNIKSDRSKLALARFHLKRVDILDFKTGAMKSVSTPDAPDLNYISSGKPAKMFYRAIDCDDRYIYVMEGETGQFSGNINVFDWEGNFVRVLRFDERGDVVFTIDPIRKKLYIKTDDEQITAYDLNYLYQ